MAKRNGFLIVYALKAFMHQARLMAAKEFHSNVMKKIMVIILLGKRYAGLPVRCQ